MNNSPPSVPFAHRPWSASLSSICLVVVLLSLLEATSIIETVLQQNQPQVSYVVEFGPSWSEIFGFLGSYDIYTSGWFVVIMLFLVVLTSLYLLHNVPPLLREARSFRESVKGKSLASMRHSALLKGDIWPETAQRYFDVEGSACKLATRVDGSVLVVVKRGGMNKWGYVFVHTTLVVICLGSLIDSNLLLELGIWSGHTVPDNQVVYVKDFKSESILSSGNLSPRDNVDVLEGQSADMVFLNVNEGLLVQDLSFSVELRKFHIDPYGTGMPHDFASNLVITDRETGKKTERTIHVNHLLTLRGVTIYQASFTDGRPDSSFKAWSLPDASRNPITVKVTSMRTFPLGFGEKRYQLESNQLTGVSVEDMGGPSERTDKGLKSALSDVRTVKRENKKYTNIGPSIVHRTRDKVRQVVEYENHMLPIRQEDGHFYITGTRSGLGQQYRRLRVLVDKAGKVNTFTALYELLKDDVARKRAVWEMIVGAPDSTHVQFTHAVENTLNIFIQGSCLVLNNFVVKDISKVEQEKIQGYFYEMLHDTMNITLDTAIKECGPSTQKQDDARSRFLMCNMDAYTGLTEYPVLMLFQLNGYREIRSSGLQITRSPGTALMYLGPVLLVLGMVFTFCIREKRAWLPFSDDHICFAMSSSRNEHDLQKEFPWYLQHLRQLAKDLNHDRKH